MNQFAKWCGVALLTALTFGLVEFVALRSAFATEVTLTSAAIDTKIPRDQFYDEAIEQINKVIADLGSIASTANVEYAEVTGSAVFTRATGTIDVTVTPETAAFAVDGTNYVVITNVSVSASVAGGIVTNGTIAVTIVNGGSVVTNVF